MKYYIYISDAKVDMLIPQIPHEAKRKIATEFGFDLKFLTAKRKSETEIDDNRITRLEAVVSFLRKYGNLGALDKPDEYFEGTIPVRIGPMHDYPADKGIIYLTGRTKKTLIGMGGSPKHMLGGTSTSPEILPGSAGMMIYEYLKRRIGDNEARSSPEDNDDQSAHMLSMAIHVAGHIEGPFQKMEFLGKRLKFGRVSRVNPGEFHESALDITGISQVLLGTPLYMALAE